MKSLRAMVALAAFGACASCQTIGAIGQGVVTVALMPVALPAAYAYNSIAGPQRVLFVYEAYRLDESTFIFHNDLGWFTDQQEFIRGSSNWRYQSAWVVDLENEEHDRRGRVVLSDSNLERWYFRDNDVSALQQLPRNPEEDHIEYFENSGMDDTLTVHLRDGSEVVFVLSQDRNLETGSSE